MVENDPGNQGWHGGEVPQPPAAPAAPPAAPGYEPPAPSYQPPPVQQPYAPPPQPGYEPPASQPYAPPAPAYGAPGQPPPPPPGSYGGYPQVHQKKSRKGLWITLATIFGVLLLAVGACTVWFISTVKAPVDEANRFLGALDAGDYPSALAMMTTTCNGNEITVETFERLFNRASLEYDLNSSSITNNNATVSGSFQPGPESALRNASQIEVYLRDRDGWKVCGFRTN